MQSAEAVTPGADVRARRRARAGPAPCRPRRTGPCSTGKTTSTSASAAATDASGQAAAASCRPGVRSGAAPPGAERPACRRGRSRPRRPRRPRSASAAATLRAEATEISCSLERPPERTAIAAAQGGVGRATVGGRSAWSSAVVVVVGVVVGRRSSAWSSARGRRCVGRRGRRRLVRGRRRRRRRRGHELADRDRHGRALLELRRSPATGEHEPVLARVGHVLLDRPTTVKPGLLRAAASRRRLVVAGDVGTSDRLRALRDRERHRRARRGASTPATGSLRRRPGRPAPAFATSTRATLEAGALERARGVRVRLADDVRHADRASARSRR